MYQEPTHRIRAFGEAVTFIKAAYLTRVEVLESAKELLATERAWCQHQYFFLDGDTYRYCLLGALQNSYGTDDRENHAARAAVADNIPRSCPDMRRMHIARWNDRPERTYEDVVSLLDRAIETARESNLQTA